MMLYKMLKIAAITTISTWAIMEALTGDITKPYLVIVILIFAGSVEGYEQTTPKYKELINVQKTLINRSNVIIERQHAISEKKDKIIRKYESMIRGVYK